MSAITAEQLADLVRRLREWTVDWDGSQMVRGEPPRDGLDCAALRDAADAIEKSVAEVERLREVLTALCNEFEGATYDMNDGSQSPHRKWLISEARAVLPNEPAK